MPGFGKLLRSFRQQCNDPEHPGRSLSQGKLGELLGRELNMRGNYSAAAVSDWELSKSKINADQRLVLVSLLKILHRLGGLKNSLEANSLLEAGNYRALNLDETRIIFPKELGTTSFEVPANKSDDNQGKLDFPLGKKFSEFSGELQKLLAEAEEGPSPSWPRVIATLLRRLLNYWSVSKLVVAMLWIWVGLLTWRLVAPSLRLPFSSRVDAEIALKVYAVGTLVTPLLIGVLANPRHSKFWQEHNLASNFVTQLYTYQGASIGFHLGYFGIFAANLVGYYLHLHFALWFEWIETGIILLWGYLAARLVPYNLWRAYGRLALTDGWIFFVFLLLGPFWAFFFYQLYPLFLTSLVGGLATLFAITLLVLITAWRQYRSALSE